MLCVRDWAALRGSPFFAGRRQIYREGGRSRKGAQRTEPRTFFASMAGNGIVPTRTCCSTSLPGRSRQSGCLLECVWHANDSFIVEPAEKCADHLKSIAQRLGLPIPPLTDKEQPPRSGSGIKPQRWAECNRQPPPEGRTARGRRRGTARYRRCFVQHDSPVTARTRPSVQKHRVVEGEAPSRKSHDPI
jgi:hypothetical protein